MGATKATSLMPIAPVPRSMTRNNKDALAEIIRTLAGNVATMHGHLNGGATLDADTPNPAPLNPGSGLRGHDHSGGIFGRPLFRSVASWALDTHESYSSNITPQQTPTEFSFEAEADAELNTVTPITLMGWVPGCDPSDGAYQNMALRVLWFVSATSGARAADRLDVRIANDLIPGVVTRLGVTGLNSTGSKIGESASSADERLFVVPGALNPLRVSLQLITNATAGTRQITARLIALEVGVYST